MKKRFYVFLDESGNTGDLILNKENIRHFNNQPYFVLGGFGIENDESSFEELTSAITRLKKDNHIYFKELKGARLWPKKIKFIYELFKYLYENDFPVFVELMDKKFFIIANIANIVGLTSGVLDHPKALFDKRIFFNRFADYLYLNLSPETIIWFSKASREPSQENVETFLAFLRRDSEKFPLKFKEPIDRMIDRYYYQLTNHLISPTQYSTPPWEYYVPPADPKSGSKRVSLLPHTTAATNVFMRVNRYSNDRGYEGVVIIHDQQEQWKEILQNELHILSDPSSNVSKKLRERGIPYPLNLRLDYNFDRHYRIFFGDSEKTIFLQLADVISSSINKLWEKFKRNYRLRPYSKKIIDIILNFPAKVHTSTGTNFVIAKFEFEKLMENATGRSLPWEYIEYGPLFPMSGRGSTYEN
ncbi:DUF3800 domain-containing protein [Thermococcus aciditolerans]|uniref:DUF3800 domain-containing protein n=1 Tax=Thermococcus aciditolerans TaxID=2598455 RepID=UPI00143CF79B|nr:DUF3800 domain-containing protein [Thermococcus aciditolerans]